MDWTSFFIGAWSGVSSGVLLGMLLFAWLTINKYGDDDEL